MWNHITTTFTSLSQNTTDCEKIEPLTETIDRLSTNDGKIYNHEGLLQSLVGGNEANSRAHLFTTRKSKSNRQRTQTRCCHRARRLYNKTKI